MVKIAIERIGTHADCINDPLYVADSFGKDSGAILELVKMSGVKFDAHHNLTTIDPPELIRFGKKNHQETIIERPEENFFELLVRRGFPIRQGRWCCEMLKERGGSGRMVTTGIRWAESPRRKSKRRMFEICQKDKTKKILNPIIDWSDADIWEFHKKYKIPHCELYDKGYKRLGCLGCPMSYWAEEELEQYPKYKALFIKSFERLYKHKVAKGQTEPLKRWKNGTEMFYWWINKKRRKASPEEQMCLAFDN